MTRLFSACNTKKTNDNLKSMLEKYKAESLSFLAVFVLVFSSLKMYSVALSTGNVEQWVNLTNQMFYGEQDFLFSYGPLYWLTGGSSSQYNMPTYWSSITFLSILNACFWSAIFTLINKAHTHIFFAVAFFLFFSTLLFPAALFTLPFVVVAYFELSKDEPLVIKSRFMIALGIMVGFLFYVRFFYGLVGLATFGSYFFIRLFSEKKISRLVLFVAGVTVSYIFFGLIIFHDKASLLTYLIINKNLSFGNSVDMTLDVVNSRNTFVAALLVTAFLNMYLLLRRKSLLLTVNVLLLLFFKLGFSRTDHYIGYFVIPTATLALIMIFDKGRLGRLLFVPTMAGLYYLSTNASFPGAPTKNVQLPAIDFSVKYEDRMQSLYADFKLNDDLLKRIGKSTIDVYPYNNEYIFANKLNYKYRPSFQNYMTLTPALDLMNKSFFESSKRPKFILFTPGLTCRSENCNVFDGFDQKFSLNEDPLTVSSILLNYHTVSASKGRNGIPLILLEENDGYTIYSESPISEKTMNFGEWYKVPRVANGATKIIPNFRLTNYGHIKNLLFRGSILKIRYKLISGDIREYRLNIINSKSGVLASPLLDNFEFSGETVDSVMFLSQSSNYFNPEFKSTWVNVHIPRIHNKDLILNNISTSAPDVNKISETSCDGSIDSINGAPPSQSKLNFNTMDLLKIQGWLALSSKDGTLFDKTFVTLTDINGKITFISTNGQVRSDLGAAFNKASLNAAGYNTLIDLSIPNGTYTLGMGGVHNHEFYGCIQYKIPLTLDN
ncbi:hypothetical protein [Pseudomonas paraveronii]|uniref:hypothetical protein n=1 Tax=Pseudomonas paraveronii TaxID=3040598 RepID=UPI002AB15023|nr:hypothetical protein [Pseudomonas sp. V3/K/3/5]